MLNISKGNLSQARQQLLNIKSVAKDIRTSIMPCSYKDTIGLMTLAGIFSVIGLPLVATFILGVGILHGGYVCVQICSTKYMRKTIVPLLEFCDSIDIGSYENSGLYTEQIQTIYEGLVASIH